MKNQTVEMPYWKAWKSSMPGSNPQPTLHIRGCVMTDIYQAPYLDPLKEPLFFQLKFEQLPKPPIAPVDLEIPKEVKPWDQPFKGAGTEVSIRIPGQAQPVKVPIQVIS